MMRNTIALFFVSALLSGTGCSSDPSTPQLVKMTVTTTAGTTPPMQLVAVGRTKRLLAILSDAQEHQFNVTSTAMWSSTDATIARVDAEGLVTGVAAGMTTISAQRDGLSGTTTMTVLASDIARIDATPAQVTLAVAGTQPLQATATLMDGSMRDVTSSAAWSSDNMAAATVDAHGLVTAVGLGQATVKATADTIDSNGVRITVGTPVDAGID